ncbi:hypothetical protein G6L15_06890 [Agrobacterium rhizogenes]|uniref:hypothetical protein n=1 Tax=Rhizobium rhizogenes TaxID=359 RepID=UPI0015742147|nr:hypothetical protein [Rhizobium rhizogenes]NTG85873.1 hypothetical protein [Rhizobium rhizogenes]
MAENAITIWADGPLDAPYQPEKSRIRAWGTWLESFLTVIGSNSGSVYTSRELLLADLSRIANTMAWVIGDPTTEYNGIYEKIGSSGSGTWLRVGDLPYSFITANTVGGTPNAIEVATFAPISDQILVTFTIPSTTTESPATVSFNGAPALRIRTNAGFDPDAGALRAGMTLSGFRSGNDFRLLTDNMGSTLLAALEALRDEAEAEADRSTTEANAAEASATEAAMYADMLNAAVYDFNFDSDPSDPGYDWNS